MLKVSQASTTSLLLLLCYPLLAAGSAECVRCRAEVGVRSTASARSAGGCGSVVCGKRTKARSLQCYLFRMFAFHGWVGLWQTMEGIVEQRARERARILAIFFPSFLPLFTLFFSLVGCSLASEKCGRCTSLNAIMRRSRSTTSPQDWFIAGQVLLAL